MRRVGSYALVVHLRQPRPVPLLAQVQAPRLVDDRPDDRGRVVVVALDQPLQGGPAEFGGPALRVARVSVLLPDQQPELVRPVEVAGVRRLDVAPEHVQPQLLRQADLLHQEGVVRRRPEADGVVILVQRSPDVERPAVQVDAVLPGLHGAHAEVVLQPVHRGAPLQQHRLELVEVGVLGSPEHGLRDAYAHVRLAGCSGRPGRGIRCAVRPGHPHLHRPVALRHVRRWNRPRRPAACGALAGQPGAGGRRLAAQGPLGPGQDRPEVDLPACHVGGGQHPIEPYGAAGLQPDVLPDAADGAVPALLAVRRLLEGDVGKRTVLPLGPGGAAGIGHPYGQPVLAAERDVPGDVEPERQKAALVVAHVPAVDPDLGQVVDRAEVEPHRPAGPRGGHGERALVNRYIGIVPQVGELRLDAAGHGDGAGFRQGRGRRVGVVVGGAGGRLEPPGAVQRELLTHRRPPLPSGSARSPRRPPPGRPRGSGGRTGR